MILVGSLERPSGGAFSIRHPVTGWQPGGGQLLGLCRNKWPLADVECACWHLWDESVSSSEVGGNSFLLPNWNGGSSDALFS